MKWDLISAVFINLFVITLACKWPFFPDHQLPHTAWEEYYIKLSGGLEAAEPLYLTAPLHESITFSNPLNQRLNNIPVIIPSVIPENENLDYILPKRKSGKTRKPFKPKEDINYLLPQRNSGKKRDSFVSVKPEINIEYSSKKLNEDKKRKSSVSSKNNDNFNYFMSHKNNVKKVKLIIPVKHEDEVTHILPKINYVKKQESIDHLNPEDGIIPPQNEDKEDEMSYIKPQNKDNEDEIIYIKGQKNDDNNDDIIHDKPREANVKPEKKKYGSKKKEKHERPFSSFKSFHNNKEFSYHTEYGDNPQISMNWKNQHEYAKSGNDDDSKPNEKISKFESEKFGDRLTNKFNNDKQNEENIFKYQSNEEVKLKIAETPNETNETVNPDDGNGKIKELYIEISDIKTSTSIPIESQFLSETLTPSFEDKQMSDTFYDTKTGSYEPLNSRNSVNYDDASSATTQTINSSLMKTPLQKKRLIPESPEEAIKKYKKKLKSPKLSLATNNTINKGKNSHERSSLSSAAIAGIIIGSFVFITLLAGAALFVIHKSPYRRPNAVHSMSTPSASLATESLSTENSLLNMSQRSDSNPNSRIHRWPPQRSRPAV